MSDRDILSNFFNEYLSNKKSNNNYNSSYSKKKNYLRKYNIFYTDNNILKFTPTDISKSNKKTINIFNNLYVNQPFKNKELIKKIYKNKFEYNISLDNKNNSNSNSNNKSQLLKSIKYKNLDIFPNNINNTTTTQNRTSSTYFISTNSNVNNNKNNSLKDEYFIIKPIKKTNKINNQNQIDERADKIVNDYMSKDLFNIKNKNNIEKITLNNIKRIEKKKNKEHSIDKKLLKIKNIKQHLILGDCSTFKSINIQIKALGNVKRRKSTLAGIKDYYLSETHKPIKNYIIDNKRINNNFINDEILNELKFDEHKINFALSDRIIKKKVLKNRVNKNIISISFNKAKSIGNKTEYLNFYQKMDCLYDKVKKTYGHIGKRIEKRQTFKDNINGLFLI